MRVSFPPVTASPSVTALTGLSFPSTTLAFLISRRYPERGLTGWKVNPVADKTTMSFEDYNTHIETIDCDDYKLRVVADDSNNTIRVFRSDKPDEIASYLYDTTSEGMRDRKEKIRMAKEYAYGYKAGKEEGH